MVASLLNKDENTVLIFAGRFMSELLIITALSSSHVVGLTSHVSFFIRLQMFSMGFTFKNGGGYSILCLSLF